MKSILINIAYFVILLLGSPWLLYKLISSSEVRTSLWARLGFVSPRKSEKPLLLLHGVSVGEIRASRTLFSALKKAFPDWELGVTSSTPLGYATACALYPEGAVYYFPLDLGFSVNRFFRRVRPSVMILMEMEIWPNFLSRAEQNRVPVFLANGRISERSFQRFRTFQKLLFRPFSKISHYCVQTDEFGRKFEALGVSRDRITVTGSLKFDTALPSISEEEAGTVRDSLGIDSSQTIFVAGSTHAGEEEIILQAFEALYRTHVDLRLILVPRYPDRADEVSELVQKAGMVPQRKSLLPKGGSLGDSVLIVDAMGELEKTYAIASLVFVGGSLVPRGGQNMIEPAALGKPVFFGPLIENFAEIGGRLVEAGGAEFVRDSDDMKNKIDSLLANPESIGDMGRKGKAFVESLRGATDKTVGILGAELRERAR